jgi:hypothetical protein
LICANIVCFAVLSQVVISPANCLRHFHQSNFFSVLLPIGYSAGLTPHGVSWSYLICDGCLCWGEHFSYFMPHHGGVIYYGFMISADRFQKTAFYFLSWGLVRSTEFTSGGRIYECKSLSYLSCVFVQYTYRHRWWLEFERRLKNLLWNCTGLCCV